MAPTKRFTFPFLLVFGLTNVAMSCPAGFDYSVEGIPKCYSVITQPLSWDAAQASCGQLHRNAHLAVVNSALENQIIQEMLKDFECLGTTPPDTSSFWTSGRRISDRCNSPFIWKARFNQAHQSMAYTNWCTGEPNCYRNAQEYCLAFRKDSGTNIQWNDAVCSSTLCSICEVVKFQQ